MNFFRDTQNQLEKLRKVRLANLIWDAWQQMQQAQLLVVAGSLAYTTILSIIPLLAVSFAIFKTFGGMDRLYETIEPMILSYIAEGASEDVIHTLHKFIDNIHAGAVGVGGVVALIFTSMSMLSSAEKAINRVWQAPNTRSLFQRICSYWFFITLGPLGFSIAVGFATTTNFPLKHLFPNGTGIFLLASVIFFCVYKWVPHTKVRSQYALIGGVVTAGFWSLARVAYGIYTRNAVDYNAVYGSLGAVPILLLWIYILWLIILGGAALTASLQKKAR